MNASDVLKYGHYTVLGAIEDLPADAWHTPGACGVWSVKDIVAHLASFEHLLVDVLCTFLNDDPTPTLESFIADSVRFNDDEVDRRRDMTVDEAVAEYTETYERAASLLDRIPADERRRAGALPWYGDEYDLEDFIVYTFYGHKREHCAQVAVFRDRLTQSVPRDAV